MRDRITGDRSSRLVFCVLIAAIPIGFLVSLLPLRAAAHDHHSYHRRVLLQMGDARRYLLLQCQRLPTDR